MIRALVLGLAAMASTSPAAAHELPARVAVVFDRESARPVIVEGLADRESGRAVGANDPVRIASISKLIMALATLRVVDSGKVTLDADVSNYLGWEFRNPAFPETPITLRQLLGHRSGLRDANGYVISLGESLRAKVDDPASWYAAAPAGEAPFEYANLGSPVVATVLEAATGERYDKLMQREVFEPLGIEACLNWIDCSDEQIGRAVILYRDTGEVARDDAADLPPNCTIPVADIADCNLANYVPGTNASIFSPQGGVRIGMMDLAKIGQEFLKSADDNFLSEGATVELFFSIFEQHDDQSFFCAYGLALQAINNSPAKCSDTLFSDRKLRIGHAGEAYGLRSGLWMSPVQGTGIAYFLTAVPPRQSSEDEGGFDPQEIEFVRRAMASASSQAKSVQESTKRD